MPQSQILSFQWHARQGTPVVLLHGLLGSRQDWQDVLQHLQYFPKIRPLTIDLPFHGLSQMVSCSDFMEMRHQLHTTLKTALGSQPFFLVGYSLGGRIALDYTLNVENPHLLGTILEGANIGLSTESERHARWQNDCRWAARFRQEPLENVLSDWYQQAVFSDLTFAERERYIQARLDNSGERIAQMLEATSLAKQPNYAEPLKQTEKNIVFFIGEHDHKFRQMTAQHQLPTQLIPNAGHNAHQANAEFFVQKLSTFVSKK